ncbi:nuclease-related domain-containing protein [Salicibibacter kimchii]|uniref:NERD domain-containing protein n=1 Tax=Salicibibacter kimchii TaxID=2099786 RepID=A0A345BYI0_9BACI|nr:nuclease-related domain-containing protein [Salicibibacter kimchii]AXF56011.1 NERD domain-containing protein [Salicibibacter kimchii]
MAHLVKLEDYISRYESDIHQYPSQFIRLKRERWKRLHRLWAQANQNADSALYVEEDWFPEENKTVLQQALQKLSGIHKKETQEPVKTNTGIDAEYEHLIGKSRTALYDFFYYELLQSQLRWASSSSSEVSVVDSSYRYDSRLRELLRLLPDNYMIFYYPIFKIQQADIQLDVLLFSPSELYCVTYVETPANTLFEVSSRRFWREFRSKTEHKRLNPLLSVKRMEDIARSIFQYNSIDFPIKKAVLLPNALIDNRDFSGNAEMIDHRDYDQWMGKISNHISPMKKEQFHAVEALLNKCKTKGYKRSSEVEANGTYGQ